MLSELYGVTGWDFDFISESLLPDLCKDASAPLKVGAMEYDMILVPGCETLRSTTLERLEGFAKAGGKLVFVGDVPTLEDARPSERGRVLAEQAKVVQFNKGSVLEAVEEVRLVELRNAARCLAGQQTLPMWHSRGVLVKKQSFIEWYLSLGLIQQSNTKVLYLQLRRLS